MKYDEEYLFKKYEDDPTTRFTDEECEWMAYYESLRSRSDSDHEKGTDPIVGALLRNCAGQIVCITHRANTFEGDHAEYSLLNSVLSVRDLAHCELFTTLEPCVDDVRSKAGISCSSLISSTPIKTVHIGILDPNPNVYAKGLTKLFENGKRLIPFSPDVQDAIATSCDAFKNEMRKAAPKVNRVRNEVFSQFDKEAFVLYLRDLVSVRRTDEPFDQEKEECAFATLLLKKGYVSFEAKKAFIDESVKMMFFENDRIKTSSRQIKIQDEDPTYPDTTIISALPMAVRRLNEMADNGEFGFVDPECFREAIANALIHRDYGENAPLLYIKKAKGRLVITNKASDNIPEYVLSSLPNFAAPSYPGSGPLAEFFALARYCERSQKGTRTFQSLPQKPKIIVEGRMVEVSIPRR